MQSYSRCLLRPITFRRTSESDAFSASRMRTPLDPSRISWSLHRTVSISDALMVTPEHARPPSVATDALPVTRSSRMV
jgi:hypothetical protein